MISRRDLAVGAIAAALGGAAVAFAQAPATAPIGPSVYDWGALTATKTPHGWHRQVMRGPTATLAELEMHVTTLDPGASSHPPHRHENEEIVILRQGTLETLSGGEWKRVGPGSVIFNASNSLHAVRNVGAEPAIYDVINWTPPNRR